MNVALIPIRGGSKSIPLKNIKLINGKPLIYWTLKAACLCDCIDKVYVSTDSDLIKETVLSLIENEKTVLSKASVISRSNESCTDTASTELVMMEFANNYTFDNIVLIQATSPLLSCEDLNGGFELLKTSDTDSVLSVVKQYRFLWQKSNSGLVTPINYDVYKRPRRQDFDGFLLENGAFYITSKEALLRTQNRVSGNIKAYAMCEESAFEIDEPDDWLIVETLLRKKQETARLKFNDIKMFLTDCDGCLTDAGMYYSENGDELKKFNTKDGMGFALLRKKGILTGIITAEAVELNKRRAKKLNLDIFIDGCKNKIEAVNNLSKQYQIPLSNIAYIGDDINDIEVLSAVGLACCPKDAIKSVKNVAHIITNTKGGEGVIREVVDKYILNL